MFHDELGNHLTLHTVAYANSVLINDKVSSINSYQNSTQQSKNYCSMCLQYHRLITIYLTYESCHLHLHYAPNYTTYHKERERRKSLRKECLEST